MAHAHESTQVKRIGIDDDDRKTSRHDLACQYLSEPKKAVSPFALVIKSHCDMMFKGWAAKDCIIHCPTIAARRAKTEYCLTKGDGKYLTTIGFLDVLFTMDAVVNTYREKDIDPFAETWPDPVASERVPISLVIEVKASKSSISEAIRQIELYRQFYTATSASRCFWVLVTLFPITASELSLLKTANIWHAQLGEDFEDFCISHSATEKIAPQFVL